MELSLDRSTTVVPSPPARLDRAFHRLDFFLQHEISRQLLKGPWQWSDLSAGELKPWLPDGEGTFLELYSLMSSKHQTGVDLPKRNTISLAENPLQDLTTVPQPCGELSLSPKGKILFRLQPPTHDISSRAQRQFEWKRFLRVSITKDLQHKLQYSQGQGLAQVLSQLLIIAGTQYRAFWPKGNTVFYFAERGPNLKEIKDFASRIISMELNPNMTVAKYSARISLSFSKTLVTITFPSTSLRFVPDLTSNSLAIGYDFMKKVADGLGLSYVPSAVKMQTPEMMKEERCLVYALDHSSEKGDSDWISLTTEMITRGAVASFRPTFTAQAILVSGQPRSTLKYRMNLNVINNRPKLKFVDVSRIKEDKIMTDGCSAMSRSAARAITTALGLTEMPWCYQGRIGAAKGIWYPSPVTDDKDDEPTIDIRDSQLKYTDRPNFTFTFEVIRWSTPGRSALLGKQAIQVLADRGVPNDVFSFLLTKSLDAKLEGLLPRNDPPVFKPVAFREAVSKLGQTQTEPLFASTCRNDIEPASILTPSSDNQHLRHDFDRLPPGNVGKLVRMVEAGFTPRGNFYMANILQDLLKHVIRSNLKGSIPVLKSTSLFVMVDPLGCLAPDEIYVQLPDGIYDPKARRRIRIVTGDVLVTRSPCVLPTDVRKVRAVNKPELSMYEDVVIFSSRGDRPLAGLLGGGDYDGDVVCVIFDPSLVEPFTNAEEVVAEPSFEEDDCFLQHSEKVGEHLLPLSKGNPAAVYPLLLRPLFTPEHIAQLSFLHTALSYVHGLGSKRAIRAGHLFAMSLDAPKAGRYLHPEIAEIVSRQHQEIGKPAWPSHSVKEKDQDAALPDANNMKTAVRSKKLAEHVMDALVRTAKEVATAQFNTIIGSFKEVQGKEDAELSSPWLQYNEVKSQSVTALELDMEAIEEMIKSVSLKYTSYCQIYAKKKKRRDEFEDSSDSFLQTVVQPLQAEFDATPGGQDLYSRHFCETPSDRDTLAAVKASALYTILHKEHTEKNKGFYPDSGAALNLPFLLAFDTLMKLKAGRHAIPITSEVYHSLVSRKVGPSSPAKSSRTL